MQMFFTSDTHFDDTYAIPYFNRPFRSVDEMNAAMVDRWNGVITNEDLVYHLGDFTPEGFGYITNWAGQLNGNMDRNWLMSFTACEKVQVLAPLVKLELLEFGTAGQPQVIVLCHYSMQVWERSNHGSWHLFGHTHGSLKGIGACPLMWAWIARTSHHCPWRRLP